MNFNNNMSTAAVFLDIEKARKTTWHPGLLYKISKLQFPANLTKLINSFLTNKTFRVSVEGKLSTSRGIQSGVPQGSVLAPTLYSLYINNTPRTPGVHLAILADDTCIYATGRKESYAFRKLQSGLNAMEEWCENWNIKIKEDKTRAVCFSKRLKRVETYLTLNGWAITFVNYVKYLGVTFDRRMMWRNHIDLIITKALRTFLLIYSLLKREKLSIKSKTTLYKALIRSKLTYACPTWELAAGRHLLKLQRLQNKVFRITGGLPRRTSTRYMHRTFQIPYVYDFITKSCRKQAEVIRNHDNENVRSTGNDEAQHRQHKGHKRGGGQAYASTDV
jgi:hypothetical protein